MKYTVKLVDGTTVEHAERNWWTTVNEGWGWRNFKVNGAIRQIPKSAILYMDSELPAKNN